MTQKHKNIYVSDSIYERLNAMKHIGQSFNGLFEELINDRVKLREKEVEENLFKASK